MLWTPTRIGLAPITQPNRDEPSCRGQWGNQIEFILACIGGFLPACWEVQLAMTWNWQATRWAWATCG